MVQRVVIVGGGLSAKHAAENLLKKGKDLEVTIVQANRFVEWPLAMTCVLVEPELHDSALSTDTAKFEVPKATYKYGVAEGVDVEAKRVVLTGGDTVPYDALVVATGFRMPLLYPGLGVSVDERKAEVQRVGVAIQRAGTIVIGGGGPVGIELAGDIRIKYPDKTVKLLCKSGVLNQWPEKQRYKMEAHLRKVNIEVIKGSGSAPAEPSLEPGSVQFGDGDVAYDVYLPAFSQGPNTDFLGPAGVLDAKGCIDVNEYLQSKARPEIFAVGVSNAEVPFIGIAKLEAQWNDATANVIALLSGKALKSHKEGASFMKLPPMITVGHGPKAFAWIDFANVPAPLKCCCCCGYAGFPCCPPCWSCCLCGGCGACPCGYCCMPAEGTGVGKLAGKLAFKSAGFHFKGMGEAPAQQSMN